MTDITDLDATAIAAGIDARRISCADVMAAFLDRIDAINPKINAIVSLRARDELMAEARAADSGPRKGPLHGVPIAIKDLVETKGIRTTHGSPLFADHVPQKDDLLAARIRAAGAILIGKTNTPEFGMGSQSYNPVHGATRNPYDLTRTAGGSTGGGGAALATRMLAVADGSDMMGSLRNPAAYNNVYGFRPSLGRVPATPEGDGYLHQLSTDGPMARTIRDLALLLDTIAGPEPLSPSAWLRPDPLTGRIEAEVKGRRIGWMGDWNGRWPLEDGILPLTEQAMTTFADLGCTVEPVSPDFDPDRIWQAWTTLRSFAIAAKFGDLYRDPDKRQYLKPEAVYEIENGKDLTAMDIQQASVARSEWFRTLARLFDRYDAIALPAAQVFPFPADVHWPREIAGRTMDTYHRWMEAMLPVSLVGLPALGLPAGFSDAGLPMGIQLFGRRGDDLGVLQLGQAYHEATDWPGQQPPVL